MYLNSNLIHNPNPNLSMYNYWVSVQFVTHCVTYIVLSCVVTI